MKQSSQITSIVTVYAIHKILKYFYISDFRNSSETDFINFISY